jgi:hypothetical protein
MRYDEYLNIKQESEFKRNEVSQEPIKVHIVTRSEYFRARRFCEEFELQDISTEFTAEDFKAFEANLEKVMGQLRFKDPDEGVEENSFETIHKMMDVTDWQWYGILREGHVPTIPEMEEHIRGLFRSCMNSGHARSSAASGGFFVATDILYHQVTVKFEFENLTADDEGDDVY